MEDKNEYKLLCELEMLTSMYCVDKELIFDDASALDNLKKRVDGLDNEIEMHAQRIGLTLHLKTVANRSFVLIFSLPSSYPQDNFEISIRSNHLKKKHEEQEVLNDLKSQISSGEGSIIQAIQWSMENMDKLIENFEKNCTTIQKIENLEYEGNSRLWIYSHHIYNSTKRKIILETAKALCLTGFCCPGKPGIICVEGVNKATQDFWHKIKQLTWHKISLKHEEHFSSLSESNWQKFDKFEELFFQAQGCRSGHLDTSELLEFLNSKNCSHIFPYYFGLVLKKQ